jgi:hypothetical protein
MFVFPVGTRSTRVPNLSPGSRPGRTTRARTEQCGGPPCGPRDNGPRTTDHGKDEHRTSNIEHPEKDHGQRTTDHRPGEWAKGKERRAGNRKNEHRTLNIECPSSNGGARGKGQRAKPRGPQDHGPRTTDHGKDEHRTLNIECPSSNGEGGAGDRRQRSGGRVHSPPEFRLQAVRPYFRFQLSVSGPWSVVRCPVVLFGMFVFALPRPLPRSTSPCFSLLSLPNLISLF